jgi:gamma-glutamyltranspeptidase/glutathione hydrolase
MSLRPILLPALFAAAGCVGGDDGGAGPWQAGWRYDADTEPTVAPHAMVVTTDSVASEVGTATLRRGGNAVDAAVAVSFALAVVNPEAGNIGGGGFMVVRLADGTTAALDYREKAPLASTPDMFLDQEGSLTDRSLVGHLSVGVPGTVRGMWEAHVRFGSLPWDEVVEPAVELARGFVVRERFLARLTGDVRDELARFDPEAAGLLPGGRRPALGDTLRLPELAKTLERIRDGGPDGFYRGETADRIVAEMRHGGGLISREDLVSYTAVWRAPIRFQYRGYTVLSMPPSSSGGVTMAEAANILERYDIGVLPWGGAARIHLLAEAWKRAFADRNHYLADPDFVEQPLGVLVSDEYARFRGRSLRTGRATPSSEVGPGVETFLGAAPAEPRIAPSEGSHTTHFSIVDADGSAVAVTTTLNSAFGSKVSVPGAGFLLNNEMDDFAASPGTPNQFGLLQGEANRIEPGKRMLSAMSPTVVLDPEGRLFMVTGSPGGPTIITTVWQTISNVIDHGMSPSQAVLAPRVHHQHLPDRIEYESGGLSHETVESLRARGHVLRERRGVSGDAQIILVRPDGSLAGQSDPRGGGSAAGY